MTTKLQRYNVAGSQAGNWPSKDGDWCVSGDVAALEAENERMREALRAKVKEWRDDAKNYFMTSSDDCANELEAILNEGEKP